MTKPERKLLERVFAAEVRAALTDGLHVVQTRSRIAEKLVEDGMLREATVELPSWPTPVSVTGYELTELGRMTYCIGCDKP